ncbi:MAG: LptF/LptG family permease [Pirellulales bacterium]|nr:LptF/LptG family permease [Pirellulales bacterium]
MKILTRYIVVELLKWFLLSLTALTLIILVFFIAREAIRRGLPPMGVIRLIPYFLPIALWFAVPGTLLLATTSVYGRLASWNEIVAIKAQGVSPRRILEPIWIMAFMASLVTVLLNDKAVSWGRSGVQHVLVESVEQIMYGRLATYRQYSAGRFAINVKGVEGRTLIRPTVSFKAHGTMPTITATAEEAELKKGMDKGEEVLKIVFHRGSVDFGTQGSIQFPDDTWEQVVPLQDASQTGDIGKKASCMPLRDIPAETVRQKALIERRETNMAAQAACQMVCGDLDALTSEEWKTRLRTLRYDRERLCQLRAEPHRRWSSGFSCLCFAFIGAPMAIRLRNRDVLTSFFLCFLPILIVYYPLLMFGVDGAKDGRLPPWSVWTGNVLLVFWGCYLLRKVIRY